jgi:hypothetical protein
MRIWLATTLTFFVVSAVLEGSLRVLFTDRIRPFVRLIDSLTVLSFLAWCLTMLWRWALHAG